MATYQAATAAHKTLAPNTVDEVRLSLDFGQVEVLNRTGTAEIYFTVDGPAPTVGGDDTFVLPAGVGSQVVGSPASGHSVVRLVSSSVQAYSVLGVH